MPATRLGIHLSWSDRDADFERSRPILTRGRFVSPGMHQSTDSPVFLDGRQHPPEEAPHVWGGFSTATWEGDVLRIETSHLKEDYIRRNCAMASDEANVTSWWIRRGDYLTWINIVHDPIYLSEPLIRSSE